MSRKCFGHIAIVWSEMGLWGGGGGGWVKKFQGEFNLPGHYGAYS